MGGAAVQASSSASYGGFIGYNTQMDQLVLGFDIGYTHVRSLNTMSSDLISRIVQTSDGYENTVSIVGQSSMKLIDYATLRGRAGYAMGQFLPYAMIGGAIGRFNYANSATVFATGNGHLGRRRFAYTLGPITRTDGKDNAFAAGLLVGAGLDVAITATCSCAGNGSSSPSSRSAASAATSIPCAPASACGSSGSRSGFPDRPICRWCGELTACFALAYARQRDTPPQRGAPIWKDRP